MSQPKSMPMVPQDLLEHLERVFPDRCPTPDMTDRDVWMAVGRAEVVRKLRQAHDAQHKGAMTN